MKKVAIIGYGYVGKAIAKFFARRYEVLVYDPFVSISDFKVVTKEIVNKECDLAVICVPTNQLKDGSCDTSIVEESVKWLKTPLILIKSTVEPGTTDRLKKKYKKRIVMSPEYVGMGKYFSPPWRYPDPVDMVTHTFQIFGGDTKDTSEMVDWFTPVIGPHVFFYQVEAKTAEVIKYLENTWGAMKVTFFNEIYDICKTLDVDYNKVREGWALDSRVEKMHSAVFPEARGYKSHCFDKDIPAFIRIAEKNGYVPELLKTMVSVNQKIRKQNGK